MPRPTPPPPDRLSAVLGAVERARRGEGAGGPHSWPGATRPSDGERLGRQDSPPEAPEPITWDPPEQTDDRDSRVHPRRRWDDEPSGGPDRVGGRVTGRDRLALLTPSGTAVAAVLVVVLVALLVVGGRLLWTRAASDPEPVGAAAATLQGTPAAGGTSVPATTGSPTGTPMPTAETSATAVRVHVVGRVRSPGVVRLQAGDRVQDAVRAAGGAAPGADLNRVNLARAVQDGEQVRVPRPGEKVTEPPAAGAATASGTSPPGTGGAGTSGAGGSGVQVDLNSADESALDALPGVGPVIAGRIVQWRTEHGRFSSVEELSEVSGIGEKAMERLRPLVRV